MAAFDRPLAPIITRFNQGDKSTFQGFPVPEVTNMPSYTIESTITQIETQYSAARNTRCAMAEVGATQMIARHY
jgi:hypothetical protein